jgi:halimadienyl-diphosphate synthase
VELIQKAGQLLRNLEGRLNASPYDIAWMARVRADGGRDARWPGLIDWLLDHQWPDGSWGSEIPYVHDRILCTLAAVIALKECGTRPDAAASIRRGARYIWNNMHFLHCDPIELVGFELILPTLLAQARTLDLDVPSHSFGYGRIRAAKLRLLPTELLYEPGTSVAFSIEFMGRKGDPAGLNRLLGKNGAIANSPATTAYLAAQAGPGQQTLGYLEAVQGLPGGVPSFYPFRTFEIVWVLEHLAFGGLALNDGLVDPAIWADLRSALAMGKTGVGIDPLFGINDGDTTSVTLHVLAQGGQPVDPAILRAFEQPKTRIFRTFGFERNASVVTNAHALEALRCMPDYPDRREVWDRIVTMLLAEQRYQSYWIDKWHASPFYATSHVLISLITTREPLLSECLSAVEWYLHTQRDDGSWGFFDKGTPEETAYALLALLHYHREVRPVNGCLLKRGAAYLRRAIDSDVAQPALWIAKTLYAPESIVRSAILSAAILYQDTFGANPE